VLDGRVVDDPYVDGLDDVAGFEVISDDGPRYRIDRHPPEDPVWDGATWTVTRIDPSPEATVGSILRRGFKPTQYQYSSGWEHQGMLINSVFEVIGEAERRHQGHRDR
jgi:hypothetical protein